MKTRDKDIDIYLANRDKVKSEDDTSLTIYFMKQIFRRVWWVILLAVVVGMGLHTFLKPVIGNIPAGVIATAVVTYFEFKLVAKFV